MENYIIAVMGAVIVALVVFAIVLARRSPEQKFLDRQHALELAHQQITHDFRLLLLQWEEFFDKTRRLSSRLDKERGLEMKKNSQTATPGDDPDQMQLPDEMLLKPAAPVEVPEKGNRVDLLVQLKK